MTLRFGDLKILILGGFVNSNPHESLAWWREASKYGAGLGSTARLTWAIWQGPVSKSKCSSGMECLVTHAKPGVDPFTTHTNPGAGPLSQRKATGRWYKTGEGKWLGDNGSKPGGDVSSWQKEEEPKVLQGPTFKACPRPQPPTHPSGTCSSETAALSQSGTALLFREQASR